MKRAPLLLACASLLVPAIVGADTDDDDAGTAAVAGALALSPAQQQAVGLTLAHPVSGVAPHAIDAYALVLDPVELIGDWGRLASTRSAARNAAAEARRVEGLYHHDANASLKALQLAQAAEVESQAQAQAAAATFALQWGPLAALTEEKRATLIGTLINGGVLLVRADVPGQHLLGTPPTKALLNVDGAGVPAVVLGALARTTPDLQSAGWLLKVERAPAGLGPGARLHVTLAGAAAAGVLIPTAALLYGQSGPYIYREAGMKHGNGKMQYAAVPVKLIAPEGDGWLVSGLDGDDHIVVHGAGVLWSLQGLGSFSAAEEEHD